MQNAPGTASCVSCGAPLDGKNLVSDSGWREAPRLRDMTEFRFANSVAQVEGELVPVTEIALGQGDAVYFEHHVLLWKDEATPVTAMQTQGGMKRLFGGMPFVLTLSYGPGRVAFSRDSPGELVVLPLHPGMELDVREHAFLLASHTIGYSFVRIQGLVNLLHGGNGMYLDRLLKPGEKIMVEPGGFLYKDASVTMQAVQMPVKTGLLRRGMYLAEMTGPGRVGIQSMYVHHHAE